MIPALIFLLTACTPTPTAVPSASTTNSNTPIPQEIIPTLIPQATPNIDSANSSASLWLQVVSPQAEAVVNTPQVDVIGSAPTGTVVSVNDDIFLVGDDQQFKTIVSLEEGPNLIEIVASDDNGNETSLILTVTYEP